MSVNRPSVESTADPFAASTAPRCASYMGCRHCEEGSLVYDPDVGASRCRTCGELD
jgi:primosomal protein N'